MIAPVRSRGLCGSPCCRARRRLRLPLWLSAYILGVLTVAYYFGVFAMSLGPAVRLCRRGQFRPDLPDRPRRLRGRHPECQLRPADPALPDRGARRRGASAGCCSRCRRCACAAPISAWSRWSRCCCCRTSIVIFAGVTGGEIGMTVPDVLSIDATTNYWYRARLPGRLRASSCSACRARRSG